MGYTDGRLSVALCWVMKFDQTIDLMGKVSTNVPGDPGRIIP